MKANYFDEAGRKNQIKVKLIIYFTMILDATEVLEEFFLSFTGSCLIILGSYIQMIQSLRIQKGALLTIYFLHFFYF